MKVFEQSQHLSFNALVILNSIQSRLEELSPQGVQSKLGLVEPPKLSRRQLHTFGAEIGHECPEARAELCYALSWSSAKLQVELVSQLSSLIQGGLAIDLLESLHELLNAGQGIGRSDHHLLLRLGVFSCNRWLVLKLLGCKFFSSLTYHPRLP